MVQYSTTYLYQFEIIEVCVNRIQVLVTKIFESRQQGKKVEENMVK